MHQHLLHQFLMQQMAQVCFVRLKHTLDDPLSCSFGQNSPAVYAVADRPEGYEAFNTFGIIAG